MQKVKELTTRLFSGETIVNKRDLWFLGGICLLAGIVYGLLLSPWTRGVVIGSQNGNSVNDCCCKACDCKDEKDTDCCAALQNGGKS